MGKNGRANLALSVEFIRVRCREKAACGVQAVQCRGLTAAVAAPTGRGAGCAAQSGLAAAVAAPTGSAKHQCLGEEL